MNSKFDCPEKYTAKDTQHPGDGGIQGHCSLQSKLKVHLNYPARLYTEKQRLGKVAQRSSACLAYSEPPKPIPNTPRSKNELA